MTRRQIMTLFGLAPALQVPLRATISDQIVPVIDKFRSVASDISGVRPSLHSRDTITGADGSIFERVRIGSRSGLVGGSFGAYSDDGSLGRGSDQTITYDLRKIS